MEIFYSTRREHDTPIYQHFWHYNSIPDVVRFFQWQDYDLPGIEDNIVAKWTIKKLKNQ